MVSKKIDIIFEFEFFFERIFAFPRCNMVDGRIYSKNNMAYLFTNNKIKKPQHIIINNSPLVFSSPCDPGLKSH